MAVTRAEERLVLFHHCQNDFLPFLATNLLPEYTTYHEHAAVSPDAKTTQDAPGSCAVTDLTKHLSAAVTAQALALLDIVQTSPKAEHLQI